MADRDDRDTSLSDRTSSGSGGRSGGSTSKENKSSSGGLNSSGNRTSGAGPSSSKNTTTSSSKSSGGSTRSSGSDSYRPDRTPAVGAVQRSQPSIRESKSQSTRNSIDTRAASGGFTFDRGRELRRDDDGPSLTTPSGGLYSSAGMTTARASENASMKAYDTYRTTQQAAQRRASENDSMAVFTATKTLGDGQREIDRSLTPVARNPMRSESTEGERARRAFFGDVVDKIIGVESGGKANAKNPNSSATGLGQFIGSTWLDMMQRHRPEMVAGKTRAEVLALRNDPVLSRQMTTKYAEENAATLRRAGVDLTPGSIYMAHFAGPDTAVKVYTSSPDTPVSSVFNSAAINANASILGGGRTIGQVRAWADRKMAAPSTRNRGRTVDLPQTMATLPTPRPEQRFADTYLGTGAPGVYETTAELGRGPDDPLIAALADLNEQAFVEKNGSRSLPPDRQVPGGLYTQAGVEPPVQSEPDMAPAATPSPAPASTARPAPAVAAAPAPATQAKPAPATPAAPVKEKDSLGEKVVAGGIDILAGVIPGPIGIGVGLLNAGLSMTEKGTIGKRIVDHITDGKGGTYKGNLNDSGDTDSDKPWLRKKPPEGESTTVPAAAKRFDELYLSFKDDTKRPTPYEKWEKNRDTYASA